MRRKFLVLIVIIIGLIACGGSGNENEEGFLSLMGLVDFNQPSMVRYFSDDYKTFFTGSIKYELKYVYKYDYDTIAAEYNGGEAGNYYFLFIINPWGTDGSYYLYMSDRIRKKLSQEEILQVMGKINMDDYIGAAIMYNDRSLEFEGVY